MAEISVIVPVYKVEPYLRRCVDSILTQTFTDFELILVDDGSPDESGAICDEYAAKDGRVYVMHQQNQGQAVARNHALDWVFANSESEYIGFVDSDDWVHPRYLELLLDGVRRYDVNICQCGYLETDGTEAAPEVSGTFSCITPDEQFIKHYSAFMWDKLFARACWETMRFPQGQIYEDVAIWYKMLFREERLAYLPDSLYYYFINPASTVRKDWTPAKLAQIDAWKAQVKFLRHRGNSDVLTSAVQKMALIVGLQYSDVLTCRIDASDKEKYSKYIAGQMRGIVCRYRKLLRTDDNYKWYVDIGYPHLSAVINKIKTVFGSQ